MRVPWRSLSASPAPMVPAEPMAETMTSACRCRCPGGASAVASSDGRGRDGGVEAVVTELGELVEDGVLEDRPRSSLHLVVDLLDVGLAARGRDDLAAEAADLLEALALMSSGSTTSERVAHARADPRAADAEVARRREHQRVLAGHDVAVHLMLERDLD
jgi:hypothetical protein